MTERQFETLWKSLLLATIVGLIWGTAWGCKSITEVEHDHPNEIKILEHTACHARHHGLEVKASFSEEGRKVQCEDKNGEQTTCWAKGWAWLPAKHVGYWGPWVRGEKETLHAWSLEMLAAHEVCHVALMTTNEVAAEFCGVIAYRDAGCH